MCGFAGFISTGAVDSGVLTRMADTIAHRGPDDSGIWVDDNIGLAHRRLSIVDVSAAGHQPMVSKSGRFVIAYNGEVYNHLSLRKQLLAENSQQLASWRGGSDTETLLACIDIWGVEVTLKRCEGMFAFALWDREERCLFLGRDRLGEKPLYFGWQNGFLLFGSELKALESHPAFDGDIDRDALTLLLRHSYIPAPYSIYTGIGKLLPGTYIKFVIDSSQFAARKTPEAVSYWSLHDVAEKGQSVLFNGDDKAAITTLDNLLKGSVRKQMVADVPLGAFLSGGVDSSIIVALMQAQSERPIQTFTIGFNEENYNEAENAKLVAQHLGTDHTELYVSPKDALEVIPRLPNLYDEPFSDSSQIPTFLISQMTQKHVTVALSGDAGDELFGGYNRHFWVNRIWNKIGFLPVPIRRIIANALTAFSPRVWDSLLGGGILPSVCVAQSGDKVHKLAEILSARAQEEIYRGLVSHWKQPTDIVIGSTEPRTILTESESWPELPDIEHSMMYLDTMSYLPNDILVKVDRAAMGASLETRVPFLDRNVVEFAWQLPLSLKIRNGQGKWILRQVLYKYVPKELIERPKMGFGVPIGDWLRGPLREWAENLLDESRLREEGYFHPAQVREKWEEHLTCQRNWQYHLWSILMFQAWLESKKAHL